jgi:hypothetical protein
MSVQCDIIVLAYNLVAVAITRWVRFDGVTSTSKDPTIPKWGWVVAPTTGRRGGGGGWCKFFSQNQILGIGTNSC